MMNPIQGIPSGAWLRYDGHYFYYKGVAPDGTIRVLPLERPPYGKTVYVIVDGKPVTERVPLQLKTSAKVFLVLVVAALVVAMALGSSEEYSGGGLIAFGVAAALGLCAFFAQEDGLYPTDHWDALEAEQQAAQEYWYEQQRLAHDMARNAQKQMLANQQWQSAQWAQMASINAALNPGTDVWRPYGQSPPLSPPM